jgi:hypothetical protein
MYARIRKILIITGVSLILILLPVFIITYIQIGNAVKENIDLAKKMYPGTAEEALIAYLLDTTNSATDRTHIAIWTLGQIKSQKAIPVLTGLYQNDPEGRTCYGRHSYMLCQYEINKALHASEKNWLPLHGGLNK